MKYSCMNFLKLITIGLVLISSFDSIVAMKVAKKTKKTVRHNPTCIVFYKGDNWTGADEYIATISDTINTKIQEAADHGVAIRYEIIESNILALGQTEETAILAEVTGITNTIERISNEGFKDIHLFSFGEVGRNITALVSHKFAFNEQAQVLATNLREQSVRADEAMADFLASAFSLPYLTGSDSGVGNLFSNVLSHPKARKGVQVKTYASDKALGRLSAVEQAFISGNSDLHDNINKRQVAFGTNVHAINHGRFALSRSQSSVTLTGVPRSNHGSGQQSPRDEAFVFRAEDADEHATAQQQNANDDEQNYRREAYRIQPSRPLPIPDAAPAQPPSIWKRLAHALTLHMFDSGARVLAEDVHVMVHIFGNPRESVLPPIPFNTDKVTMTEFELTGGGKTSVGCSSFCTSEFQLLLSTSVKAAVGIAVKTALAALSLA